jgi:hypothetical protein
VPACWRPVRIVTCPRFALSCAHTRALNALRETQLDQDRRITGLDQKVTEGFATLSTGLAQITALLTGETGSDSGR